MQKQPRDLVHDQAQRFTVDRAAYADQQIYEQEIKRVFEGTWVYLAHESQVKNPGSFFSTYIGRQPVFVTRNKSGEIRGFINACSHRGATLCRTTSGECKTFVCSYHGWSFDHNGKNIGVKERNTGGYLPVFDEVNRDLTPIARLACYRGFIFGSLNPEVPSLEEHLGAARPFIDMFADPAPEGLEVVRGASTYTYEGNWKLVVENVVDGYHFNTVHPTFVRIVAARGRSSARPSSIDAENTATAASGAYDLGRGHSLIWANIPNSEVLPLHERRAELVARHGQLKADWMIGYLRNLVVYPNLMLLYQIGAQVRVARPLSVDRTEVATYCMAPAGESPRARELRVLQYADFFGASGVGTPDDLAQFNACQTGYAGRAANIQGFDRGMARTQAGADETAQALGIQPVASSGIYDETVFHGQFREWVRLMTLETKHAS